MACKTESKPIGDHEYSVTQWPAEKALLIKFKLTKVLGAALASLASLASDKEEMSSEQQGKVISEGFSLLFNSASPEEILALIKECIVGVSCDGYKVTESKFTELFSGDELLQVYQVFIFVLQVNYGNFIKGQLAENLLAKMKETL